MWEIVWETNTLDTALVEISIEGLSGSLCSAHCLTMLLASHALCGVACALFQGLELYDGAGLLLVEGSAKRVV